MHPRWSGWLQRKEDSQPKQYYFWQWIIRLAHQPAMIFTVIRFTQVLFFFFLFLLFLGCPERQREGPTDGWMNRRNKNNSANSPEHLREHVFYEEEPFKRERGRVLRPLQWAGKHVPAVVSVGRVKAHPHIRDLHWKEKYPHYRHHHHHHHLWLQLKLFSPFLKTLICGAAEAPDIVTV